jgi:hypothetical protein
VTCTPAIRSVIKGKKQLAIGIVLSSKQRHLAEKNQPPGPADKIIRNAINQN